MTLGERLAGLNRAQQTTVFKSIASALVALLVIAAVVAYTVRVNAPVEPGGTAESSQVDPNAEAPSEVEAPEAITPSAQHTARRALDDILAAKSDPTGFAIVAVSIGGVAIGAIWLGLGLTYLFLLLLSGLILYPLVMLKPTQAIGLAGLGLVGLVMSFTVLLQGLRVLLSGPGPVFAVAKNVLAEAVRMKISLVFIVMVMLLLAALPGMLNADQPLRYRVQAFMSFGTGLSFWVIAVLTILFSAATLSSEQRQRIIWQTMTKPVSAWSYVLGKWLGVVSLNAVLLVVCASGIFGFVEYLRGQPAVGESTAYVAAGTNSGAVAPDRLALEEQILTARVVLQVDPAMSIDDPNFQAGVDEYIKQQRLASPEFAVDPKQRQEIEDSLFKSYANEFKSVAPGRTKRYTFSGLGRARDLNLPLVFRHRVNVGGNAPDKRVEVAFAYGPLPPIPETLGAGVYQTVQITPCVILQDGAVFRVADRGFDRIRKLVEDGTLTGAVATTADIVEQDGTLFLEVLNGQLAMDRNTNQMMLVGNDSSIVFPPDGMEMSYQAGGYRGNFLRGITLLWVKLAFIAMLTITASTFLSFPVSCMVSFGSFLAAEGSSYLLKSVEVFGWDDDGGVVKIFKMTAAAITAAVGKLFSVYDQLNPIDSIINGKLITWNDTLISVVSLGAVTLALFLVASFIFSKRELAIYSGK